MKQNLLVVLICLCGAFLSSCAWKGTGKGLGKSPSFSILWTQGIEFRASGVDVEVEGDAKDKASD